MEKIKSLYKRGGGSWYFEPSKAMRRAGFSGKPFGNDYNAARDYVLKQLEEWDKIKDGREDCDVVEGGSFIWLIARFQDDPTWYKDKAPRTREEMDFVFNIIEKLFGARLVVTAKRRHARALYNKIRAESSAHKARKVMKWFRRLMKYAVELGIRDDNPASEMQIETTPGRSQRWQEEQVEAVIAWALKGGVAKSGNKIPARPSVALATLIAYDTSLPQADVLALTWKQFDGQGLTVMQKKKRGGKELWIPLSDDTLAMINAAKECKASPFIIISEETGRPYLDEPGRQTDSARNVFSRIFRRFKKRAGVEGLTFQDLRRSALSELGDEGATNAEIVSWSGHSVNSRVLDTYVKPDKQAAKNAHKKRGRNKE
jgi:integrase